MMALLTDFKATQRLAGPSATLFSTATPAAPEKFKVRPGNDYLPQLPGRYSFPIFQ